MKKFIVFVLILVVTVSLGVTTYYFMRDTEELIVNTDSFVYMNKGDILKIDAELKNAKIGNELIITSLNTNVLAEEGYLSGFEAKEGGIAIIEVKTKNSKIKPVYIEVSVGNGMEEAPYYVDSEEALLKIGNDEYFTASSSYVLMQDITLSTNFTPLCSTASFTGKFNGNGYSIKNLVISDAEGISNAGLFTQIGATGIVTDLTLSDINISGQFATAGGVAGVNEGTITRCEILGGNVISTLQNSSVGGVCGINKFSNSNYGRIDRVAADISVSGPANVGGLTGKNEGAIVINSYAVSNLETQVTANANNAIVGGLIGLNVNQNNKVAIVKNCYTNNVVAVNEGIASETCKLASLIGYNDEIATNTNNYLMGLYSDSEITKVNHEFNLTFTNNEKAKATNFRGINAFPKDSGNKIISANLISFVSKASEEPMKWDFTNVWKIVDNENNGYPLLIKDGANVPDEIETIYDPHLIYQSNFFDIVNEINNGTAGEYYRLAEDIDLENSSAFTPIGTSANPFNGTLDGNGFTIRNVLVSDTVISSMNTKYAGLFGKISSVAVIKNLTVEDITINDGATYAGGIVAYNEGTIENCKVTQTARNKEVLNIKASYSAGGIAGISLGKIDNCKVINQSIAQTAELNKAGFAGGIAGLNGRENSGARAVISNSSTVTSFVYDYLSLTDYAEDYRFDPMTDLNNKVSFVGGIAGGNYYLINKNYVYSTDIAAIKYDVYACAAGIVGFSRADALINEDKAEISYNRVLGGTLDGHACAGLSGIQYGKAEYNSVEMDTIHSVFGAGLTNRLAFGSKLYNCYSKSHFTGMIENSRASGMATTLDYKASNRFLWNKKEIYGEMGQVFSACTFEQGLGRARYEVNLDFRSESTVLWTTRFCGYANNLIWEVTGNAKSDDNSFDTKIQNVWGCSKEQATSMEHTELIDKFSAYGFDMTKWYFGEGEYPSLIGLPEIAEIE